MMQNDSGNFIKSKHAPQYLFFIGRSSENAICFRTLIDYAKSDLSITALSPACLEFVEGGEDQEQIFLHYLIMNRAS